MVQSDNATEPYGDREDVGVEQPFVGALPHLNISTPAPESKHNYRQRLGGRCGQMVGGSRGDCTVQCAPTSTTSWGWWAQGANGKEIG